MGSSRRWAHNCECHNFPQIQIRNVSNFKCELKGCQGDAAAAKAELALASTSLPLADALGFSPVSEQRESLHWAPCWSLLPSTCQSTTCFTHFLPHGLMETGFRQHLTSSWAVTYISSACPVTYLLVSVAVMLWRFSGLLKFLHSKYSCLASEFIRVKYEVKKLGFGLFSIWPLTELSAECLSVKAFFQLIERCCDLP